MFWLSGVPPAHHPNTLTSPRKSLPCSSPLFFVKRVYESRLIDLLQETHVNNVLSFEFRHLRATPFIKINHSLDGRKIEIWPVWDRFCINPIGLLEGFRVSHAGVPREAPHGEGRIGFQHFD